ncbi:MAG: MMPL family transporter [Anaerovoracaceae bacterium]|nr:MMPL family transporter [Bacillota bacterium]MDY2670640.1 MMPL family transporter [Anaerovoracaceae bacterium]
MLRFGKTIVRFRIPILILAVILLIPSIFGFINTKINYDVLYYLPDSIDSMEGQQILMDEFGTGAYGIFVCDDMSDADVLKLKHKVEKVDHVKSVLTLADTDIPVSALPQKVQDTFYSNKGNGQLMFMFMDTSTSAEETLDAIDEIQKLAGKQAFLSSMSSITADTRDLTNKEEGIYVLIAVLLSCGVMMLFMDSFLVPLLFLADIGIAIIYNLGTNGLIGEISFITMALAAVLQLAVTMDYSIFLYGNFEEQREIYSDRKEAMAHAIANTIVSVSGSSLTTIAGFIALCFMSFTLGLNLGLVMAKGVVLGVVCCVTILPSLLLMFDKPIQKTAHFKIQVPPHRLSAFIVKHHRSVAIIMLVLWIPAVIFYNNINLYYKLDNSLPKDLPSVQANQKLKDEYGMNSISMVLVHSDLSRQDTRNMTDEISDVKGVQMAAGYDSVIGASVPDVMIPDKLKDTFESGKWKMLLVSSEYQVATDQVNKQCTQIEKIIKKYDSGGMLVGEAPATRDLIKISNHDFNTVSAVSILMIFIIILLVLKSASLPVILVFVIEEAIYINLGLSGLTGTQLPFIANIVIGTIQLGATVDYAILMTTRYKTERMAGNDKQSSVLTALSTSMNSIITSALGFFAATFGVGLYSDVDLISSICVLMARGALISMVMVLVLLPSLLMLCDKFICKTTGGMRHLTN